jgi:hypothetical protein
MMKLEDIKNHEERCAFDSKPLEPKPIESEAPPITSIIRNPLFETVTIERW